LSTSPTHLARYVGDNIRDESCAEYRFRRRGKYRDKDATIRPPYRDIRYDTIYRAITIFNTVHSRKNEMESDILSDNYTEQINIINSVMFLKPSKITGDLQLIIFSCVNDSTKIN